MADIQELHAASSLEKCGVSSNTIGEVRRAVYPATGVGEPALELDSFVSSLEDKTIIANHKVLARWTLANAGGQYATFDLVYPNPNARIDRFGLKVGAGVVQLSKKAGYELRAGIVRLLQEERARRAVQPNK